MNTGPNPSGAIRQPFAGNPLAGQHATDRGPPGKGFDLKRSTRAQETWDLVSGNLSNSFSDSSALD